MWIVYYSGSDRKKATFYDEKKAREFHKIQGGDLVCINHHLINQNDIELSEEAKSEANGSKFSN